MRCDPGQFPIQAGDGRQGFRDPATFLRTQQSLSLSEVVERTGFERTIVFRILKTLEEEGLLRRPEGRRYFSNFNIVNQKAIPDRIRFTKQ